MNPWDMIWIVKWYIIADYDGSYYDNYVANDSIFKYQMKVNLWFNVVKIQIQHDTGRDIFSNISICFVMIIVTKDKRIMHVLIVDVLFVLFDFFCLSQCCVRHGYVILARKDEVLLSRMCVVFNIDYCYQFNINKINSQFLGRLIVYIDITLNWKQRKKKKLNNYN